MTKQINIRLPHETIRQLEILEKQKDMTRTQLFIVLIDRSFRQHNPDTPDLLTAEQPAQQPATEYQEWLTDVAVELKKQTGLNLSNFPHADIRYLFDNEFPPFAAAIEIATSKKLPNAWDTIVID